MTPSLHSVSTPRRAPRAVPSGHIAFAGDVHDAEHHFAAARRPEDPHRRGQLRNGPGAAGALSRRRRRGHHRGTQSGQGRHACEVLRRPAALLALPADISREEQLAGMREQLGPLDHVVSTAADIAAISRCPRSSLRPRSVVASKLYGPLLLAKHGAPRLSPGGSLTFVSGIAAHRPAARARSWQPSTRRWKDWCGRSPSSSRRSESMPCRRAGSTRRYGFYPGRR